MKHRATPLKPANKKLAATGAWLRLLLGDDPLVVSIHSNNVEARPIDGSLTDMDSVLVAMEINRRQTYSAKVARSESLLQMNDARVLRSVPTAGVS